MTSLGFSSPNTANPATGKTSVCEDTPVSKLLRHRHLWQASRLGDDVRRLRTTGYKRLDQALGGWVCDGMTEILSDYRGIGELRLLMPALAQQSQSQLRWIAWIAPPWRLNAPALVEQGAAPERMLMIHPKDQREWLWATEQALKSGSCSVVLAWPPARIRQRDLQRLRLAARQGCAWLILFRGASAADLPSPADQRLVIQPPPALTSAVTAPCDDTVSVKVHKRTRGWGSEFFTLPLFADPRSFRSEHLHAQLERWRALRLTTVVPDAATQVTASRTSARAQRMPARQPADAAVSTALH